ncbi:hypothetical protein HDV04_000524 [Boothiomyces sp. JEL0838]|nr:hypothetical protein HDV04_000524 [Boothiomyces sp. JEL0838]
MRVSVVGILALTSYISCNSLYELDKRQVSDLPQPSDAPNTIPVPQTTSSPQPTAKPNTGGGGNGGNSGGNTGGNNGNSGGNNGGNNNGNSGNNNGNTGSNSGNSNGNGNKPVPKATTTAPTKPVIGATATTSKPLPTDKSPNPSGFSSEGIAPTATPASTDAGSNGQTNNSSSSGSGSSGLGVGYIVLIVAVVVGIAIAGYVFVMKRKRPFKVESFKDMEAQSSPPPPILISEYEEPTEPIAKKRAPPKAIEPSRIARNVAMDTINRYKDTSNTISARPNVYKQRPVMEVSNSVYVAATSEEEILDSYETEYR